MRATSLAVGLAAVCAALVLGPAASAAQSIVVNTLSDTYAANSLCTLREAIENHNLQRQQNTDCAKGKKKDTITFSVGGTILLAGQLPQIEGKLTINGGGVITLQGPGNNRIMQTECSANLTLSNIVLTNGNTFGDGGALLNCGHALLDHTTFTHNTAGGYGGGVDSPNSEGKLTVVDSQFDHNTANIGGGLAGVIVAVTRTQIMNNSASSYGGGLYAVNFTMADSSVSNNSAGTGMGGVYGGGFGSISGTTIDGNSAMQFAGVGLQVGTPFSDFVLDRDTISNNHGQCQSAGLAVASFDAGASVLVKNTTIDDNTTTGGCGNGGGGVFNAGPGQLTFANSTIAQNATTNQPGGGIYTTGAVTLLNTTVSANLDNSGVGAGGVYVGSSDAFGGTGVLTSGNSIIAFNTDGDDYDCSGPGTFLSNGHNIDTDGSCYVSSDDLPNTDPELGPLGPNGGPTATMLPSSTSPALGFGKKDICNSAPVKKKDQRGVGRPQGSGCDTGSVERVLP